MDIEQMHTAASEEYKNNYSSGEFCHEQSFLWGFQEGVEFSESNTGKALLYVAQKTVERIKKELKIKARKWLEENNDKYITDVEGETIIDAAIIEDFLKAMEE